MMHSRTGAIAACLALTGALSRTRSLEEIYDTALDALRDALGVARASILLFDADGVMRFKAFRGLSARYRTAVEGHTPWTPETQNAEPLVVGDVTREASLAPYLATVREERIAAMTFIPLLSLGRVVGKFMLYYEAPYAPTVEELQLAAMIASQVAFAVERMRAEAQARRNEERLRFALDAAAMGTWDWDLLTQRVVWSDNLERVHGLPDGTFDGSFASYEREIHPEDRERVLASAKRAIAEGVPHEVEYRIVAPDGTVRWVEGKGRVEFESGRPVRMSGVCMIVTRRKEAELARLAAAEEASRLKDDFLATLSHELRTPLNAILGWTQLLEARDASPARTRQAVEVIGRNARLQARLIEDILDVSRIIAGKLEIERLPVHMPQLIDSVVSGLLPAAEAKRLRLVRDVREDLPPIDGDPRRLQQVLGNVLSNAVKFTPEGGSIELRCTSNEQVLEIAVADSGVGIAPEFLPYLIQRFRQADSGSTRRYGGLGLGLAIARYLVEQHGGEIHASSPGPDQGTVVTIRLPAQPYAAPRMQAPAIPAEVPLDGATVVVVDDQNDSRELLGRLIEQCGARVVQCRSARAALEALQGGHADLLVADIAMPDVDGYELLRNVRASGLGTPAVAVSAHARPEDRERALACGYGAYCTKPIDAAHFLETVREVIARAA